MSLPATTSTTTTATHAVVQAVDSYIQNQNLLGEVAELDDLLYDLVDMHKDNELALKRVLLCIYNLLQTNSKWNVRFGPKLFHKLVSVVIADSREDTAGRRQLVAHVLVCVQLHTRKFPRIEGKFVLQQLWSLSLSNDHQPHAAQILVHLFDDFMHNLGPECAQELVVVTQNLLKSQVREDRRSAYFLMRKLQGIQEIMTALQCSEQQWSAYVGIMENLEEQQSHLVLPTLSTLLPRLGLMSTNRSENWHTWLRILCVRLLANNNILVLRWILKYFFSQSSLSQLARFNLLPEFLAATNRTQLFNPEVPDCLTLTQMSKFMKGYEVKPLLKAIVVVPWHCVPLAYWLNGWHMAYWLNGWHKEVPVVSKELLLQLCARVRALQNPHLRSIAIKRVMFSFSATIAGLTVSEYLNFMESLYNTSDDYYDHEQLQDKIEKCNNLEKHIEHFNRHCCELVLQNSSKFRLFQAFLLKLRTVPRAKHGWWRLPPLFMYYYLDKFEEELDFCISVYGIDILLLKSGMSLEAMQLYLLERLECQTREEKSFVREHCVDIFASQNLSKWSKLQELNIKPLELIDQGTDKTFSTLACLLSEHNQPLQDDNVLPALITRLGKKKYGTKYILKYALANLNREDYERCFVECVKRTSMLICNESHVKAPPSSAFFLEGLLAGETTTGDERIEIACSSLLSESNFASNFERDLFITFALKCNNLDVSSICDSLLTMNNELSRKKTRYFANSKEHRIKMRIGKALLRLSERWTWSNGLWEAALCPNDQLNISFMFEYLVAKLLPSIHPLIEQLKLLPNLKPSQQVSLISIVHIYCYNQWDNILGLDRKYLSGILADLLPLAMGANFQTRLMAQLVLHQLCTKCKLCSSINLPEYDALKISIEKTLGDKLYEFQNEARFMLPLIGLESGSDLADNILWMTNAPFDEYGIDWLSTRTKLKHIRKTFEAKMFGLTPPLAMYSTATNGNVQRKMNPVGDIYPDGNFADSSKTRNDYELIVVASLIDKLPNLGGLARTCEVLGVKTLILGLKSHTEKSDFTNLSMTAEKTLDIVEVKPEALAEFLMGKQEEGYRIVGAEQTAHSTNFVDFKFPKKTILLLGHEKHGIPADLIGFLDYAVEIPQFGFVRSLNVHVTGSLFIWEYCKQHLAKH